MRDYWLTQDLLQAVGLGYAALVLAALAAALYFPRAIWWKAICAALVMALASILPMEAYKESKAERVKAEEFKARQAKARAVFEERCKGAGERIYKRVANIEGILLSNIRQADKSLNKSDRWWPDAALPQELPGDSYIRTFLYWEHDRRAGGRGYLNERPEAADEVGFRYADVPQADGRVLRYRLKGPATEELINQVTVAPSRFVVSFANDINPDDREYWIAGTVIDVTDRETGELLARRRSYSFEPGLGSTSGFRQPWHFAETCPPSPGWSAATTRFFVDQVIEPSQK